MHLARNDVETNWAWVVVLEVLQRGTRDGRDLVTDGLSSWAREGRDDGRSARLDSLLTEVDLNTALVRVGGRLGCNAAQLLEVDLAVAGEGERGGLEILLLREEEDERAGTGVGRRNVEVVN